MAVGNEWQAKSRGANAMAPDWAMLFSVAPMKMGDNGEARA